MYAANVPLNEDTADRSKHFTLGLLQAVKANRRPHYLYGTNERMTNRAPTSLPPLRNTFFYEYNPLTGTITKESDRDKIKELIEALQPYIDANKADVGYDGERNAAGQRHGHGTFTYPTGDVTSVMVMVILHILMVMYTLANLKMERRMVVAPLYMRMVTYMLENIKIIYVVVVAPIHLIMVMYMMGNGKMI
jgi:hypothetical protein